MHRLVATVERCAHPEIYMIFLNLIYKTEFCVAMRRWIHKDLGLGGSLSSHLWTLPDTMPPYHPLYATSTFVLHTLERGFLLA